VAKRGLKVNAEEKHYLWGRGKARELEAKARLRQVKGYLKSELSAV
jgi:hypothetical protein